MQPQVLVTPLKLNEKKKKVGTSLVKSIYGLSEITSIHKLPEINHQVSKPPVSATDETSSENGTNWLSFRQKVTHNSSRIFPSMRKEAGKVGKTTSKYRF